MSETDLGELERQMKEAQAKSREAQEAASAAVARYRDAKLQATGFKECVAEFTEIRGWHQNNVTVRFLVTSLGGWSDNIRGRVIRADGSIGTMFKECSASVAKNLGPYKRPSATFGDSGPIPGQSFGDEFD
ncbi:MAG: hypothetical protein E5X94_00760 [Mesorhizobium sp.]|uniref:hypothetical protein n=1 Tax=unclassified Mesorhizobium TaxID=325217 RepID=UPI000FC9DF07|nr:MULTISPECIES: hypothetical protein [unclassified Mesorhizobium]RUW04025.1 hypothetical protein EOA49_00405 [Mesorhizobium sp. M1A.F.Ca.IN.020.04.1.1]RUW04088.1 hypothetical protein EOA49_00740 [Mesorhizobium sp. M1A.F.Ca.IN.020.04.1.1]TIN82777.1 MAG: hypothetical protein E5X97_29175 [Mesorhizobium sp.]TIN88368.1 MAG: hypothetical protein E5X94_00760 [Mesorhizobium sp.]